MARHVSIVPGEVRLSRFQRGMIESAAERYLKNHQVRRKCQLRIRRHLNEGESEAQVLEAEWLSTGASDWSVIKLDHATRLAREAQLRERFPSATSFMEVVPSFDLASPPDDQGCLLYTHAGSLFAGEIQSLADVCSRAVEEGGTAERDAQELVQETIGILFSQLHKGDTDRRGPGGLQLEFYLKRWFPAAVVSCQSVLYETGTGKLRLFTAGHKPGLEHDLGSDENVDEGLLGQCVRFEANEWASAGCRLFVNATDEASFEIKGVEPRQVVAALGANNRRKLKIQVEGEVERTRRCAYAERLEAVGLDPAAETFRILELDFSNPLPQLQKRATRWAMHPLDRWPTYSYGHGDLHGGNVLCVRKQVAIIDHALAGDNHPSWADATRLIGSLWRVMAKKLTREEVIQAIDQAFRQSEITVAGRAAVAARLLREAIDCSLRCGPKRQVSEFQLWVDLHHFAWIGLKWDGDAHSYLSMILLASIAAEKSREHEQRLHALRQFDSIIRKRQPAPSLALMAPDLLRFLWYEAKLDGLEAKQSMIKALKQQWRRIQAELRDDDLGKTGSRRE